MQDLDLFPPEIIENILTRLPVKPLCRFKCVSKPWLSLISSERFVKSHLNNAVVNLPRVLLTFGYPNDNGLKHCSLHSLLNSESEEAAIDIDYYPGKHLNRNVSVVGSCNGLVCLETSPRGRHHDLYLWNPCTRKHKKLPPIDFETDSDHRMCLSDELSYNVADDDYKVMRILMIDGKLEILIYSLRADSWKTKVFINSNIKSDNIKSDEHLFFDGKIHMGPFPPTLFDIVSFDLESGVHETAIQQPDYGEGVKYFFLKELGGCFCVIGKKETHADLWVMKEYGVKESWTKVLTVSFHDYPLKAVHITPLVMLPSGEILVAFLGRLEVYNLKDNITKVLDTSSCGPFAVANLYFESLVSPTQHERMGRDEDE